MVTSIVSVNCSHQKDKHKIASPGDNFFPQNLPPQPGEDKWKFTEDLKSPMWTKHPWKKSEPGPDLADLSGGVNLRISFPDPGGRLETAYEDLRTFFSAGNVPCNDNDKYLIETVLEKGLKSEEFRLDIGQKDCRILAGDTEGIRRGIFLIENEMLGHRGPFLTMGMIRQTPVIQRRISRCFFGPVKRPPKMRDELMDDTDYYPDQYLNRLAHEGVNGLWLTVEFRDLVSTSLTPDGGKDAQKRLAKLQRTVESCLRYGIRTYIFCIEPRAWEADSPVLKNFPEMAGGPTGDGHNYFCPCTETSRKYLYASLNTIFKAVPELGGMINISVGERPTLCLSEDGKINCPRCSQKAPWEILYASLSAMEQGMHDAAPDAELISWIYLPQPQRFDTGDSFDLDGWVYEISAHTPKGVILQFNFESGISKTEFGKLLVGGDYWISNPGPSERFVRVAKEATRNGTKVSAKIQTGNSHEVATVPYVPVPSLLYRKFSAMKNLGVTHAMLCWYFGNYPGLMNMAAGMLSSEPFPKDETAFLNRLAAVYWKEEDIPAVVEAWKDFSNGYANYPLINLFQYYGPMADGPVWPLFLKPVDKPLSPTWLIGSTRTLKPWPPSGDRIGECIGDVLTLQETIELARRMSTMWDKGVAILKVLEQKYSDEPERILDIGVARALGIQFRSGYNILRFYLLREEMFQMDGIKRLDLLKQLGEIINEELELDSQLLELCRKDSRLGFHSEAEGYKYYPEKIRWRMEQLINELSNDMKELRNEILANRTLFPEYTGKKPSGPVAYAKPSSDSSVLKRGSEIIIKPDWQHITDSSSKTTILWTGIYDKENIYLIFRDSVKKDKTLSAGSFSGIEIRIEPRRLFPSRHFVFYPGYGYSEKNKITVINKSGVSEIIATIPLERAGLKNGELHPIRLNIILHKTKGGTILWMPDNPVTERLILGSDNPADLGWLIFHD